jgi:transposase
MVRMPTAEEIAALQQALADATRRSEELAEELRVATGELRVATGEVRVLRTERDLLKEQLNQFKRQLFAAKSEAGGQHQKDMFFNEAEAEGSKSEPAGEEDNDDDTVEVPGHQRRKRGRKPLDPALPREVVRHEVPEDERVCPHDGSVLQEIGVEASEQLDIIPQQVRVIRHERVKYACPCCDGGMRVAPKPPQVIPKGLLTEAAHAWVITSKYLDGLPLYRQAALLGRFGGTQMSRNTLSASVVRIGLAVQPVVNLLRDELLESPIVHGDETEVQVLKEPGRKAQAKSYMWVQMTDGSGPQGTGPPIRLFAYAPSRSLQTAKRLYAGMRSGAVLMSDGYEPYESIAGEHRLLHLGCWAHARRYFHEALQALPKDKRGPEQLPARFITLIGELYRVEARARVRKYDVQRLQRLRNKRSVKVIGDIEKLLLQHLHSVLPGSLLGKALHYLSSQWEKLVRYAHNGSYPIDNNACENSIRPFVVGRRNWLFSDTMAGANASANLYSLLQTCKAGGVDGYQYLRELLIALPRANTVDDYEALLPWHMKLGAP